MKKIFFAPGLDCRLGGVQVSAADALQGRGDVKCVIYGSAKSSAIHDAVIWIASNFKFVLVARLLFTRSLEDIAVFWHCSMLRLSPFMRGFKGKKVVFLHGIEVWRTQSPSMIKKLEKVDLFLSNSDFTWNRFLEFSPQFSNHRHITIPLGFGMPVYSYSNFTTRQRSVLIIARMLKSEDYKGHRQLIQAWPAVLCRVAGAVLDIVGEGDLKPELELLAADLGVSNYVRFHGRVSESVKESLLRNCGVFAMPSRGEGFGIVYLEAMRYGTPCIVSNCDAAREVVNPPEAGFEVDPRNIDHLANSIVQLLSDHDIWSRMSAAASARYQAQYTVEAYRRRLWAAIDTVLK